MTTIIFDEQQVGFCVPASELQLKEPKFNGQETLVYVTGGFAHEVRYLAKTPDATGAHFQISIVAGPEDGGRFFQHMYVPYRALAATIKAVAK